MILILQILIWTSPWTHFIVYYDENGLYNYGPYRWLFLPYNAYFMIYAFIDMLVHRRVFKHFQKFAAGFYLFAILTTGIFQFFNPEYLIIGVACSIALILCLLTMMNPVRYKNLEAGTLSRIAFNELLHEDYLNQPGSTIIFHITNSHRIKDLLGLENAHYLFRQYTSEIQKICDNPPVFYLFDNTYAITFKKKYVASFYAEKIAAFLEKPFTFHTHPHTSNTISYPVYMDIYSVNNFDYIAHPIPDTEISRTKSFNFITYIVSKKYDGHFLNIEQKDLIDFQRKNSIREIVAQAIDDESFECFLQPIYDLACRKFTAAEALIRLRDSEGNFVPPNEFIPFTEKNGDIIRIGDIMLQKTCEFIKIGRIRELGIEKVNVNVSMVQIMKEGIVDHIIAVLDKYTIPKEMITIEVTESMAATDEARFRETLWEFQNKGFTIAMDDFGTGYSNVAKMLTYQFDEIKFDKSLVDIIPEKVQTVSALIDICKGKNMITLAEGVETEEVAAKINRLKCDLVQGFFYAKPMPREEFVNFIMEKQIKSDN